MIEMAIAVAIMLVVLAISVPNTVRAIRTYRLGSAAINMANILQRTRYEAIKANQTIFCLGQPIGTQWQIWIDLNGNKQLDPNPPVNEPYILPPSDIGFQNQCGAQVPPPASMGYNTTRVVAAAGVSFDSRGTIDFQGAAPAVLLVYMCYPNDLSYGYRAIAITPSGKTKIWRASPGGPWFGD